MRKKDQIVGGQANFYAVITAEILYHKALSPRQKLLMALINNLSNHNGFCWATDIYFGKILNCDARTIQRDFLLLEKLNLIERANPQDAIPHPSKRIIIPINAPKSDTTPVSYTTTPVSYPYDTSVVHHHDTSVVHNNKYINNKIKDIPQNKFAEPPKDFKIKNITVGEAREFYEKEIKNASGVVNENLLTKYKMFVDYIFGKNPFDKPLESMLIVENQLNLHQFDELATFAIQTNKTIKQALELGANTPSYWNKKKSVYLTLKNWMR